MQQLPDTTDVEPGNDNNFKPIAEDFYLLKIIKYKTRTSQKGNHWLKVWFKTDGFPGFIWGDISLSPDKLRKLKEFKVALSLPDSPIDMDSVIDRTLWGHCFDDDGYANVDRYAATKEELDDDLPF